MNDRLDILDIDIPHFANTDTLVQQQLTSKILVCEHQRPQRQRLPLTSTLNILPMRGASTTRENNTKRNLDLLTFFYVLGMALNCRNSTLPTTTTAPSSIRHYARRLTTGICYQPSDIPRTATVFEPGFSYLSFTSWA